MTPNNPWDGMRDAAGQPQQQPAQTANLGDLDAYGDCKPEHVIANDLETLRDGDYDMEVTAAAMESVKANNVARISLKVNGGAVIRWTCWLNSPTAISSFLAEMLALGFDSHHWGPRFNRPYSVEIPKAVAQLAGKKFRGHKSSWEDKRPGMGGKMYHDLRVICPLDTARPMPPISGAQPLAPPLAQPPTLSPAMPPNMPLPVPASITGGDRDGDIPF